MTAEPLDPAQARVGPYRLMTRIGEGGMGVVHLAQGPDGRRVALKVLRPHIVGDTEARERLAREVSSLQRISSPRIAQILDADPHGPTPYVVTRYVPGLSLYHHVAEEGVIAGRDLWHFADALAEALEAVHAVGVLHRDVKPTNVLMEGRSPVLIDFGLARVAEDPRLTQTGFLIGTPGYLAPEILYGDDATAAADVHAWAATVVFAATGRAPYGRGPAMAIMDRVRRGEHDLHDVPEAMQPLLRDCLAPDAWDRPTLRMVRDAIADQRHRQGEALRPIVDPPRESGLWTLPVHPEALADPDPDVTPRTGIAPLGAPAPLAAVPATPVPPPVVPELSPSTRVMPLPPRPDHPTGQQHDQQPARPARTRSPQRVLQLLGLGALSSALVAYAPYAGTAVVALVVLVVRTFSVTAQRHGRRQLVRGRARWYDVPVTTMASPAYVVMGLLGTLVGVVCAGLVALALFSLGYLLHQPSSTSLVLAGLGFTPVLWWGPGATRLRRSTRGFVERTSRTGYAGWFVAVTSLLGAAVLLGLLLRTGANWAPELSAPWSR